VIRWRGGSGASRVVGSGAREWELHGAPLVSRTMERPTGDGSRVWIVVAVRVASGASRPRRASDPNGDDDPHARAFRGSSCPATRNPVELRGPDSTCGERRGRCSAGESCGVRSRASRGRSRSSHRSRDAGPGLRRVRSRGSSGDRGPALVRPVIVAAVGICGGGRPRQWRVLVFLLEVDRPSRRHLFAL